MSETTNKKSGKKIAIAIVILAVAALIFGVVYVKFAPEALTGTKDITIEVTDDKQETITYQVKTKAEYLRGAMEDAGIDFSGTDSEYGLMVETVNGVYADYAKDNAYWAFLEDGEYCNYGVDTQPVEDGKTYQIEYTYLE